MVIASKSKPPIAITNIFFKALPVSRAHTGLDKGRSISCKLDTFCYLNSDNAVVASKTSFANMKQGSVLFNCTCFMPLFAVLQDGSWQHLIRLHSALAKMEKAFCHSCKTLSHLKASGLKPASSVDCISCFSKYLKAIASANILKQLQSCQDYRLISREGGQGSSR